MGRKQERSPERIDVLLSSLRDPSKNEVGATENISAFGARVNTGRAWKPDAPLLIKSSRGELWAQARVVYCQPIRPETFALGLEFSLRTGEWIDRLELFSL